MMMAEDEGSIYSRQGMTARRDILYFLMGTMRSYEEFQTSAWLKKQIMFLKDCLGPRAENELERL